MGRRRAGWTRLVASSRNERAMSTEQSLPGEGGNREGKEEPGKRFIINRQRKNTALHEGGHSQASISEQENTIREGGHSQSSNGINSYRDKIDEGGHNQCSTAKHLHYGHHGRYNDSMDF